MAQVPNYQVPAHPSGLEMRTQLNAIILALIGDNAGPTEPAQTFPGMWWGDTVAGRLRRRTNANDAWVDIGPLDDFIGDVRATAYAANENANNRVLRTGDGMTGRLDMNGNGTTLGEIRLHSPNVSFSFLRAAPGGGTQLISSDYTRENWLVDDSGNMNFAGRIMKETEFWSNDFNGYSTRIGFGSITLARYGADPDINFGNTRDSIRWRMYYTSTNDYFYITHAGGAHICIRGGDGNIYTSGRGWIWNGIDDAFNTANSIAGGKADRYANCQHNSGIIELDGQRDDWTLLQDMPGPFVVVGLRRQPDNWLYLRGLYLRNN
jgi:hypothetical protein